MSRNKQIYRYAVVDTAGNAVAVLLDKSEAELLASEAVRGLYRKIGWLSLDYKVVERKVEVAKTTGTLFF